MEDLWQNVPKERYWMTFRSIVNLPGKSMIDYGDIYLLTVRGEQTYFYSLEGRFYMQPFGMESREVKSMCLKKERDRKILGMSSYPEDKTNEIELKQTVIEKPKFFGGYDYVYNLTMNNEKVDVKRIGVIFPEEAKKKINLE